MVLRILRLLLLLLWIAPGTSVAADAVDFPGIGELIPAAATLDEQSGQAQQQIRELAATDGLEVALQKVEQGSAVVRAPSRDKSRRQSVYIDQLQAERAQVDQELQAVRKLQERLTRKLTRLDQLRTAWLEKKRYWSGWRKSLPASAERVPTELFPGVLEKIDQVIAAVWQADNPLLAQQARISRLSEALQDQLLQLDATFERSRRELFQKGRDSLFAAEFWRQFTPELWQGLPAGARHALGGGGEFLQQRGLLMLFPILLGLALALAVIRYRPHLEETSQWRFICRHPWATGLFVTALLAGLMNAGAPPSVRLLQACVGIGSAAVLVASMAVNPRRGLIASVLAATFVVSLALRIIELPLPLYRLYLIGVTGLLLPLFILLARRNHQVREGRLTWFTASLRFGAMISLTVLAALLAGYVQFSMRLLDTAVESVFVCVFAFMAQRLAAGGVSFLFDRPLLRQKWFFRQFGNLLEERLHRLITGITLGYALLYLTCSWGLFHSVDQAFTAILSWGLHFGDFQLTVGMVAMAAVTLYLTLEISWLLQVLVDHQLLARRKVDRGVRDAFRKLLHYGLVLIGLLFALSLLGLELQHFVVVAGAFGVGIGFGLQDIVNNFISGIILLFERPIKVGDGVLIDGEYGVVQKIGLRSTVVETLDQSELIVPNSQIISQKLTNWTLSTRRVRIVVPVGVAYGSDVPLVLKILVEAGEQHEEVLDEPKPSPIFVAFGDSSLDFELRVWIADVDKRPRVKSELLQFIDRRFREEGVEIPFPQRDLHLRSVDGEIIRKLPEGESG